MTNLTNDRPKNIVVLNKDEYELFHDEIEPSMCGKFYGHWCYEAETAYNLERDFEIHKDFDEYCDHDNIETGFALVINDLLDRDQIIVVLEVDDNGVVGLSELIFGKDSRDEKRLTNYKRVAEFNDIYKDDFTFAKTTN